MSDRESLDVAVVGAGPAGLILARRLSQTSANFRLFERHRDVGGIWDVEARIADEYVS